MPQISVIVPVYKVEKYIHRCVDSILNQMFTDFELILVDDGSPDNCPAICDEYVAKDSRIQVIHQENGGLSAARNAGIDWAFANSDSQWLTFIDSDDWVYRDYLLFLYRMAMQHEVKISICSFERTDGKVQDPPIVQPVTIITPQQAYLRENNRVTAFACGTLYFRDYFRNVRFPVGKLFEDIFTTYKVLFQTERIAYSDTKLYYYYMNAEGITAGKWKPERMHRIEALEEQLIVFDKDDYEFFSAIVMSYIQAIVSQYSKFSALNSEDVKKYAKYKQFLIRKLRISVIKAHFHRHISIDKNTHLYETAFPNAMHLYWYWVAILRRLRIRKV